MTGAGASKLYVIYFVRYLSSQVISCTLLWCDGGVHCDDLLMAHQLFISVQVPRPRMLTHQNRRSTTTLPNRSWWCKSCVTTPYRRPSVPSRSSTRRTSRVGSIISVSVLLTRVCGMVNIKHEHQSMHYVNVKGDRFRGSRIHFGVITKGQ